MKTAQTLSFIRHSGLIGLCVFSFFGVGCVPREDGNTRASIVARLLENLDRYEAQQKIVLSLLEESNDPDAVKRETLILIDLSLPLLVDYMLYNPRSRSYLQASKRVLDELDHISEGRLSGIITTMPNSRSARRTAEQLTISRIYWFIRPP